jgi:hypothetical protein
MATGIKTGGRTKGTPNRTTTETKELLQKIVSNELDNLQDLLEDLNPKERLDVVIKLLPYILPKQQEIAIESTQSQFQPITVTIVKPDEVRQIVNELESKY